MPSEDNHNNATRGYVGEADAAHYVGYSRDQFRRLVRKGIFPRGTVLTANSKAIWSLRLLDAAIEKAARSRKPRRQPRGILRQRMEADRSCTSTS